MVSCSSYQTRYLAAVFGEKPLYQSLAMLEGAFWQVGVTPV
jgi:hypothetical protein